MHEGTVQYKARDGHDWQAVTDLKVKLRCEQRGKGNVAVTICAHTYTITIQKKRDI